MGISFLRYPPSHPRQLLLLLLLLHTLFLTMSDDEKHEHTFESVSSWPPLPHPICRYLDAPTED
jgi:hypothetical protein